MNNQELTAQIQRMDSELASLKSTIGQMQKSITSVANMPSTLDNYLDQNSKDIINAVFRANFKQVKTIVAATFTLLPQSQYIQVSGTASRTSSTTKAISNGNWIGQTIFIEGTDDTNTVIFKDNANTALAGDATLGKNDTLTIMWNGTIWIELARSNN